MTLERALERAAEHLPQGWNIRISVENGAGWIRAERPDGTEVELYEDETDFADQVCAAVQIARLEETIKSWETKKMNAIEIL